MDIYIDDVLINQAEGAKLLGISSGKLNDQNSNTWVKQMNKMVTKMGDGIAIMKVLKLHHI